MPALVIAVAEQAFVVTQLGLRLGDRLGETARDAAEQLAGVALLTLGAILLVRQLGA